MGLFFLLLIGSASIVKAEDIRATLQADSSVYSGVPDHVDGGYPWLWAGYDPTGKVANGLVKFARPTTSAVPNLSTITSAKLRLYIIDEDNRLDSSLYQTLQRAHTLTFKALRAGEWTDQSLSWNTKNSTTSWSSDLGQVSKTIAAGTARKTWVDVDVTDIVKKQASVSQSNITILFEDPQASASNLGDIAFATKEYKENDAAQAGTYAPQLIITVADAAPATPQVTGSVIVRTTFQATPAQEPVPLYGTPTSPWPRVAIYLNNGYQYGTDLSDAGCTVNGAVSASPTKNTHGCGKPNMYTEKLVEEFEVAATTFTKDTTIPAADLFFPPNGDASKKYTKLSYVFHNDYWNPGLNLDRGVAVSKIEILEAGTNRLLRTLNPAETNNYIAGVGTAKIGIYIDMGVLSFAGATDSSQDGMTKAFDTQEKGAPAVTGSGWFMNKDMSLNFVFTDLATIMQCQGGNVGDLDGDKDVDIFDYNKLISDFGKTGNKCFSTADIDGDGDVDIFDYNKLIGAFGKKYS